MPLPTHTLPPASGLGAFFQSRGKDQSELPSHLRQILERSLTREIIEAPVRCHEDSVQRTVLASPTIRPFELSKSSIVVVLLRVNRKVSLPILRPQIVEDPVSAHLDFALSSFRPLTPPIESGKRIRSEFRLYCRWIRYREGTCLEHRTKYGCPFGLRLE
jgi:hypothetical protein